jgi:hypothetical protein
MAHSSNETSSLASTSVSSASRGFVNPDSATTPFEGYSDLLLGLAFLLTALIAAKRMSGSRQQQGGAETTVVTAFYSLILLTRPRAPLLDRRCHVRSYSHCWISRLV